MRCSYHVGLHCTLHTLHDNFSHPSDIYTLISWWNACYEPLSSGLLFSREGRLYISPYLRLIILYKQKKPDPISGRAYFSWVRFSSFLSLWKKFAIIKLRTELYIFCVRPNFRYFFAYFKIKKRKNQIFFAFLYLFLYNYFRTQKMNSKELYLLLFFLIILKWK